MRGNSPIGFSFISPTPANLTGLSSYADSLIAAYSDEHSNQTIRFITNADPAIFEKINGISNVEFIRIGGSRRMPYKIWSIYAHFKANLLARFLNLHCLVSITPQGSFIPFVHQLIIVHDTYDLERQYQPLFHVVYSRMVRKLSIQVAKGVICVSETTLNDVLKLLKPPAYKFIVIKEASKYEPLALETYQCAKEPPSRFLFVANVERTKNVDCLLEALQLSQDRGLSIEVDWIGRDPSNIVGDWIRENGKLGNFFPHGYVTDEALRKCYKESTALIVPSLREGFCLPVLEAHSFGTPVISSDIPVLREVVGAGGMFFKMTDPEDLLNALRILSSDLVLLQSLRHKAIVNARLYSWARSAAQLERFAAERCHFGTAR